MLRILYLESNRQDRELLRVALSGQMAGHTLTEATNKVEFLGALEGSTFDLVLSDSTVFGFDGTEALALVRQQQPKSTFIFLTSHRPGPMLDALKHSGADDVLSKDDLKWLGGAIGAVLRKRKERTLGWPTKEPDKSSLRDRPRPLTGTTDPQ